MAALETVEEDLRSAVESRQYRDVERLVVAYCDAARTYVRSLSPEDPALRETQLAVNGVLQWSTRMLQTGRESIVLELNRLPRVQRYLQSPPPVRASWRMDG